MSTVRIALLVLAGTEAPSDTGRIVNALETAQEAVAAGDDLKFILDGAATGWVAKLADPAHRYHKLYAEMRPAITGACAYCARAYGVADAVAAEGIPMLSEHHGHPSVRNLVVEGYEVITF